MDRSEMPTRTNENENTGFIEEPDVRHSNFENTCPSISHKAETSTYKQTRAGDESSDVEVEIVEELISDYNNNNNRSLIKVEHRDTAESRDTTESSSSSFDDTFAEDEDTVTDNDVEFESEMNIHEENLHSRKKKLLTPQWRSFVRPIVWRCKWAELQMRKFQSLARKCDDELEKYRQRKQSVSEGIMSDDYSSKSFPSTSSTKGKEIMRRRKRRRVEETEDVALYISRHNLFSYHVNKKCVSDAARMDDGWGCEAIPNEKIPKDVDDHGVDDEMLPVGIRDRDNYFEQIMRMIATVHTQVKEMKNQIHKLMSESSITAELVDKLDFLLPSNNPSASTSENLEESLDNIKETNVAQQPSVLSDYKKIVEMPPIPEKDEILGCEEVSKIPDMIERKDDQPQAGCRNPNVKNEIIIVYNRRPKQPPQKVEKVSTRPTRKHKPPKFFDEIETSTSANVAVASGREGGGGTPAKGNIQTNSPKIRSISSLTGSTASNKRKRSSKRKSWSGSSRLKRK